MYKYIKICVFTSTWIFAWGEIFFSNPNDDGSLTKNCDEKITKYYQNTFSVSFLLYVDQMLNSWLSWLKNPG